MLMSIVLDPQAFDSVHFATQGYSIQAVSFLEGVLDNAVIVVDAEKALINEVKQRVDTIPIKHRQRVSTLLEEILKLGKRRVYCTTLTRQSTRSENSNLAVARRILLEYNLDAVLVNDSSSPFPELQGLDRGHLAPLSDYVGCSFENRRRIMFRGNKVSDQLSPDEMEDLFYRAVRFSSTLRFYDPYIGKSSKPDEFFRIIDWIFKIWQRSVVCTKTKRRVEIYTKLDSPASRNLVVTYLEGNHVNPLQTKYNLDIRLYVKQDPRGIFHARYLESDTATILLDRGFDLYDQRRESYRRCEIKLSETSRAALSDIRHLKDA